MLPTLVAPTGIIEKKPWRHRPRRATRSLRTKRSWSLLAIQGETEKSSPVGARQSESEAGRREHRLTSKVAATLDNPARGAVEAVVVSRGEVDDGEEELVAVLRDVTS